MLVVLSLALNNAAVQDNEQLTGALQILKIFFSRMPRHQWEANPVSVDFELTALTSTLLLLFL
jgi:hypothetical protein